MAYPVNRYWPFLYLLNLLLLPAQSPASPGPHRPVRARYSARYPRSCQFARYSTLCTLLPCRLLAFSDIYLERGETQGTTPHAIERDRRALVGVMMAYINFYIPAA